jgi:hypothetical protein
MTNMKKIEESCKKSNKRIREQIEIINRIQNKPTKYRKLSESLEANNDRYAYCQNCKEIFIDDIGLYGALSCPNCGRNWYVLRGYTLKHAEKEKELAL